jgi:broad specificity phosphatase PhoE
MLYLVRHGQTVFNVEGRLQGGADSPLTDLGRAQAISVGVAFRDMIKDGRDWLVVSSPQGRARETARLLCQAAGYIKPVALDRRLAELRLGAWEGMTGEDVDAVAPGLRQRLGFAEWLFVAPKGESKDQLMERSAEFIAEAVKLPRPVIAVTHGIASRALRAAYRGISFDEANYGATAQGCYFHLSEGEIRQVDCHRDEAVG